MSVHAPAKMTTNFYRRPLPDLCTAFASDKGKQLFKDALDAGYMNIFFSLGPQLRTQDEPAYCGLSSLVMILNALAVDPGQVWKGVWRWYHENMLDCCSSLDEVKVKGVTMPQLMCIARCNQLDGESICADDDATIDRFRLKVMESCKGSGTGIIVSFGRQTLKQTGTGHFAPVGGYNRKEDYVLMLEPARFKYPPFWVPLTLLWKAMKTFDTVTGLRRGYMVLTKSTRQPTLLFRVSPAFSALSPLRPSSLAFIREVARFLRLPLDHDDADDVTAVQRLARELISRSQSSSDSHLLLLLLRTRLTEERFRLLSPQHQHAVSSLVGAIERTAFYRALALESFDSARGCCDQLFDQSVQGTTLGSCVLCFPHLVTILLHLLPVFLRLDSSDPSTAAAPDHPATTESSDGETATAKRRTYADAVRDCVAGDADRDRTSGDETSRRANGDSCAAKSPEEVTSEEITSPSIGRRLLLNEVEQLQQQMFNVVRSNREPSDCDCCF